MSAQTIGDLFEEEPDQWGLRGDPFLWREMQELFAEVPLPSTSSFLVEHLEAAFLRFTGHPISTTDYFFIERFAHGGMSSGYVAPEFWRDHALPLLIERYTETKNA